jgi:hypothetical protein
MLVDSIHFLRVQRFQISLGTPSLQLIRPLTTFQRWTNPIVVQFQHRPQYRGRSFHSESISIRSLCGKEYSLIRVAKESPTADSEYIHMKRRLVVGATK